MKNVITIIILVVLGLIAYNHFNKTYTPDEQFLRDLESDFNEAKKIMRQSERASAASGVDTTSGFEQGLVSIRNIRLDLMDFISDMGKNQKNEDLLAKAKELKTAIDGFLTRQGYPSAPE